MSEIVEIVIPPAPDVASQRPVRRRVGDSRIDHQPGFVLHSYAWRETSLVVETFTREFGRVAVVARGAKRPTSQFRGLLSPFNPLALSWSGQERDQDAGACRMARRHATAKRRRVARGVLRQ